MVSCSRKRIINYKPMSVACVRDYCKLPLPLGYRWVWVGVGVLIFANILFLVITILAHQFLDSFEGTNAVVSEDMLNEREVAKKGHTDAVANPSVVIDVKVICPPILYQPCVPLSSLAWRQRSTAAGCICKGAAPSRRLSDSCKGPPP